MVSQGERSPSARGTEALQSCFPRPGLHSMTTGRRQSSRSTCRRRGARLWRLPPLLPRAAGILALAKKKAEGKRRKNRGGDITPIRLLRRLRRQPRPAGPLAASPARPSRPSPADPAGPAAVCPAPPNLPWPALLTSWGSEVRAGHETRITNHGLYPSSTASQRNEVMAVVSRASPVRWGEMQASPAPAQVRIIRAGNTWAEGLFQARLPRPRRVRLVAKSCTGCAGVPGGRASAKAQG